MAGVSLENVVDYMMMKKETSEFLVEENKKISEARK